MRRLTSILLCLASLSSASCTVERGDPGIGAQQFPDAGTDTATTLDASLGTGVGAGTMAGTWLAVHEASTCVLVDEQVTWASYLVEIDENDRVLTERRRQCETTLSPVLGLQIFVGDAVLESIEMFDVDQGYVASVTEGGAYTSATEVSLWGLALDDVLADPVPTEPDDPGVIDADDDGNPGVTFVTASGCERYVTQRTIVRYFGTFTAPNQIDGSSVTVTDSNVVGSSTALCGVAPRISPNDAFSRFRMVRVDGAGESIDLDADGDQTITCAEAEPYFAAVLDRREASPQNCN